LQSLLPFPKEIEKKLFDSSKDITYSVLYGHFIIGIIQGLIVGIGFFIFGVPNALVITLLTIFAAILPMVGAALIWIPVVLYLIIAGNTFPAIGVFVFGCLSSVIENLLRPFFVSKRTNLNSSLILIGMIGGVLSIGVLGLIIGPLVIAYLLILLELYRSKKNTGLLIYND
jgi:predicted PurR-regulated permease PerM